MRGRKEGAPGNDGTGDDSVRTGPPVPAGRRRAGPSPDRLRLEHQARRLQRRSAMQEAPEQRRSDRERRVRYHVKRTCQQTQIARIGSHHDQALIGETVAKPGCPTRMELDGHDPVTASDQLSGDHPVAGTDVEDEAAGREVSVGDESTRARRSETVPAPQTWTGHGASPWVRSTCSCHQSGGSRSRIPREFPARGSRAARPGASRLSDVSAVETLCSRVRWERATGDAGARAAGCLGCRVSGFSELRYRDRGRRRALRRRNTPWRRANASARSTGGCLHRSWPAGTAPRSAR